MQQSGATDRNGEANKTYLGQLLSDTRSLTPPERSETCTDVAVKVDLSPYMKIDQEGSSLTVYRDRKATADDVKMGIGKLDAAFPNSFKTENEKTKFYAILTEMVIRQGLSSKQLSDAIYNCLVNCKTYKQINISDIVGYDKRLKLYGYNEMCVMVTKGEAEMSDFYRVKIRDKYFYIKKSEAEMMKGK